MTSDSSKDLSGGESNSLLLGFYGDDFTGSTDAMESLARAGLRTVCFLDPPTKETLAEFDGSKAFGIAGHSRTMTPAEMDGELTSAFTAMRHLNPRIVHYKTCSTFDSSPEIGSIGRAIDIGAEVFAPRFIPLVVGVPALGRYCAFGNLFARSGVDSAPYRLDRHPSMSNHPITPMRESDLRMHLSHQTGRKIGLLDTHRLSGAMEEKERNLEELLESGSEVVLFDVLHDDHLNSIGQLIWNRSSPGVPLFTVGSSGIGYAMVAYWRKQNLIPDPSPFVELDCADVLLVLSGSCSPITERQIDSALQNGFAEVAPATDRLAGNDAGSECETAARRALEFLGAGQSVIVHTARGADDPRIASANRQFESMGMSQLDIKLGSGRFFGDALAGILTRILRHHPLKRVVVAGGDTSSFLARSLGIDAVEMIAPLSPGAPMCRIYKSGSPMDGLEICFKGGQMGGEDLFLAAKNSSQSE